MQKVAIVTDSISALPKETVEQYGIEIVPIHLYFQGKVYRDWIDISPDEAYELFLKDPESFTTSPASPGHYLEAYHKASNRAKSILCITLSSKISTGYEMACVAKDQAKTDLPQVSIAVLDSQNVTASEGFIALTAARAAAEGKDLTEVTKVADEMRSKTTFFILLDTIRHVYRTGRIPKIASQVGSLLSVKPILTTSSGLIRFAGAVRNKERGTDRILQMLKDRVGQRAVHVAVMHAYALEEAKKLKDRIAYQFNCAEPWITEFSPVMGYACSVGTIGFAFYADD